MEEVDAADHLRLHTGQHFSVLFDVALVFSTNLDPAELADDAFLRRIGYKIQRLKPCSADNYHGYLEAVCALCGSPSTTIWVSVRRSSTTSMHPPVFPCLPAILGRPRSIWRWTTQPTSVRPTNCAQIRCTGRGRIISFPPANFRAVSLQCPNNAAYF